MPVSKKKTASKSTSKSKATTKAATKAKATTTKAATTSNAATPAKAKSVAKPVFNKNLVIGVIIVAIIGGYLIGKFGSSSVSDSADSEVKSSGLDSNKRIRTVGDVEEVVSKWIAANPKAILESVTNMQRQAAENQKKDAVKNISKKQKELYKDKTSGQHAPRGYNATIVEFFDYNCGYCKKVNKTVEQLIASDKKVRVIYKEFPILGAASTEMSKVAIAVQLSNPKAYVKFHNALMNSSKRGKTAAIAVASQVGINATALEGFIKKNNAKIDKIIQDNIALGSSVGVTGTPGFIIGEELIPGAVGLADLKAKVAAQRKK